MDQVTSTLTPRSCKKVLSKSVNTGSQAKIGTFVRYDHALAVHRPPSVVLTAERVVFLKFLLNCLEKDFQVQDKEYVQAADFPSLRSGVHLRQRRIKVLTDAAFTKWARNELRKGSLKSLVQRFERWRRRKWKLIFTIFSVTRDIGEVSAHSEKTKDTALNWSGNLA